MLQIISGRFFGTGHIEEMDSDAILYSNLSWVLPIRTEVMELRPADLWRSHGLSSYVVRYTNRYERRPSDAMVMAGSDEAVDQFRLLTSFWFKAFFHPDHSHIELLCRPKSRSPLDQAVPRLFVPRFFTDGLLATAAEAEGLGKFVAKVLAMPRSRYRLSIACVAGFFSALEAIGTNFDLAYSLLVYVLEALGQKADGYVPAWHDYDQPVRERLETVFAQIGPAAAAQIQSALLGSAHLKAMKRFVGFVTNQITESFFTTEAAGVNSALPKSQLERALRNLYNARSSFVHELTSVRQQLRISAFSTPATDMIVWQHEPYLTLAGLVRLTHHVLTTFIARQDALEREDWLEWRSELPGTIRVNLPPQFWIGQAEGFVAEQAHARFAGLLAHLAETLRSNQRTTPDMAGVMTMIEKLVPTCHEKDRTALVILHWLYHKMTGYQGPDSETFLKEYEKHLEACSVEMLAVWPLFYHEDPRWTGEECVAAFEGYRRRRYCANALQLPVAFETAIMAQIANRYLGGGDPKSFVEWADRSTLDAAGRRDLQEYLSSCKRDLRRINPRVLIGIREPKRPAITLQEAWDTCMADADEQAAGSSPYG
jgi:hypothetical protein